MDNDEYVDKEISKLNNLHNDLLDDMVNNDNDVVEPKKARSYKTRVTEVTAKQIMNCDVASMASSDTKLFEKYLQQQLINGNIYWRAHNVTDRKDVIVLNDYDIDSGYMLPNSYVHVSIEQHSDIIITCDCKAYTMISEIASKDGELIILSSATILCMHARFVKSYMIPNYDNIIVGSTLLNNITIKLEQAFQNVGKPVQLLNKTEDLNMTIKFCVFGADLTYEFVHLSDSTQYISCQSGSCNIEMGLCSRRRSHKLLTLDDSSQLCPHLSTMLHHASMWSSLVEPENKQADILFADDVDQQTPLMVNIMNISSTIAVSMLNL